MTPSGGSDFSDIAEKLAQVFQAYFKNHSTYSFMTADIMKVDNDTGDITIDEVKIVLLSPVAFEVLNKALPLLHKSETRAVLIDVLRETLDRLEGQEDESEELPG